MLKGIKTYIVGIASILYGIIVEGWNNNNWDTAITIIMFGLGLLGLRAGITNTIKKGS